MTQRYEECETPLGIAQEAVSLVPAQAVLCAGQTASFRLEVGPAGARVPAAHATYRSSDVAKLEVEPQSGLAIAKANGTVRVTATDRYGRAAEATVRIYGEDECCEGVRGRLVILLDTSKSLLAEMGGQSAVGDEKEDFVLAFLVRLGEVLARFGRVALSDTYFYTFDTRLVRQELSASDANPLGAATGRLSEVFYDATDFTLVRQVTEEHTQGIGANESRVVVLISDGVDTVNSELSPIIAAIRNHRNSGLRIIAVGLRAAQGYETLYEIAGPDSFINVQTNDVEVAVRWLVWHLEKACIVKCHGVAIPGNQPELLPAYGYFTFRNFDVTRGTVDLLGPGALSPLPDQGKFVRLNGAGTGSELTTASAFDVADGDEVEATVWASSPADSVSSLLYTRWVWDGGATVPEIATSGWWLINNGDVRQFSIRFRADRSGRLRFKVGAAGPPEQPTGDAASSRAYLWRVELRRGGHLLVADDFESEGVVSIEPYCGPSDMIVGVHDPVPPRFIVEGADGTLLPTAQDFVYAVSFVTDFGETRAIVMGCTAKTPRAGLTPQACGYAAIPVARIVHDGQDVLVLVSLPTDDKMRRSIRRIRIWRNFSPPTLSNFYPWIETTALRLLDVIENPASWHSNVVVYRDESPTTKAPLDPWSAPPTTNTTRFELGALAYGPYDCCEIALREVDVPDWSAGDTPSWAAGTCRIDVYVATGTQRRLIATLGRRSEAFWTMLGSNGSPMDPSESPVIAGAGGYGGFGNWASDSDGSFVVLIWRREDWSLDRVAGCIDAYGMTVDGTTVYHHPGGSAALVQVTEAPNGLFIPHHTVCTSASARLELVLHCPESFYRAVVIDYSLSRACIDCDPEMPPPPSPAEAHAMPAEPNEIQRERVRYTASVVRTVECPNNSFYMYPIEPPDQETQESDGMVGLHPTSWSHAIIQTEVIPPVTAPSWASGWPVLMPSQWGRWAVLTYIFEPEHPLYERSFHWPMEDAALVQSFRLIGRFNVGEVYYGPTGRLPAENWDAIQHRNAHLRPCHVHITGTLLPTIERVPADERLWSHLVPPFASVISAIPSDPAWYGDRSRPHLLLFQLPSAQQRDLLRVIETGISAAKRIRVQIQTWVDPSTEQITSCAPELRTRFYRYGATQDGRAIVTATAVSDVSQADAEAKAAAIADLRAAQITRNQCNAAELLFVPAPLSWQPSENDLLDLYKIGEFRSYADWLAPTLVVPAGSATVEAVRDVWAYHRETMRVRQNEADRVQFLPNRHLNLTIDGRRYCTPLDYPIVKHVDLTGAWRGAMVYIRFPAGIDLSKLVIDLELPPLERGERTPRVCGPVFGLLSNAGVTGLDYVTRGGEEIIFSASPASPPLTTATPLTPGEPVTIGLSDYLDGLAPDGRAMFGYDPVHEVLPPGNGCPPVRDRFKGRRQELPSDPQMPCTAGPWRIYIKYRDEILPDAPLAVALVVPVATSGHVKQIWFG